MEWWVVVLLCVSVFIAIGISQGISEDRKKSRTAKSIEERIRGLDDFEPADVYASDESLTGVAIDVDRQEILLADEGQIRRFTVPSIVSCEILEDEVQIANVNRGSHLAGAAVGGILAGGAGAVTGALAASRRQITKGKKIVLRFVVDDFDRPNHDIVFLDWPFRKGA